MIIDNLLPGEELQHWSWTFCEPTKHLTTGSRAESIRESDELHPVVATSGRLNIPQGCL